MYNPEEYDYVTKNTRWRYLWEKIWEHKLNLCIKEIWTPQKRFINDINIMETASKDGKYKAQNRWKLELINNYRLYLQCTFIGDLTNPTGKVARNLMSGDNVKKNTVYFSYSDFDIAIIERI